MSKQALKQTVVEIHAENGGLPEGWVIAKLPELANINMGQSPPGVTYNETGKGLPFFQGKADFGDRYPTVRVWCGSPKKIAQAGDVLLSIRAPVGPTNIADKECAIGRGLAALAPLGGIPTEFLLHAFREREDELSLSGTGSTFAAINKSDLQEMEFWLPPLAEQYLIVAQVEALLARVNAARERLTKVPAILKRFRQSVLAAACSGQLTADWRETHSQIEVASDLLQRVSGSDAITTVPTENDPIELPAIPDTWAWSRCNKLCQTDRTITYGVIKLGPPVEGGVRTLRSSDVRWLFIDDSNVKSISEEIAADYSRTFVKGREILVTVRGTLGGVAVVPTEMVGFNISREVAMIPLIPELSAKYFCYAIASIYSQNWLSEVTKGVAYTGINIRDLKLLPLSVPPLPEQHEIVRRVEALFAQADRIVQHAKAATERVEKTTQSILARAFRGELVETEAELARREGREYESAAQLLARIQAEREKSAPAKPTRKSQARRSAL